MYTVYVLKQQEDVGIFCAELDRNEYCTSVYCRRSPDLPPTKTTGSTSSTGVRSSSFRRRSRPSVGARQRRSCHDVARELGRVVLNAASSSRCRSVDSASRIEPAEAAGARRRSRGHPRRSRSHDAPRSSVRGETHVDESQSNSAQAVRLSHGADAVADLEGGRAGSAPPPVGRRTDAVTHGTPDM